MFYKCFIKNFAAVMALITKLTIKTYFSLDKRMLEGLGVDQTKVY
jgi:hypothetical protein